MGTRSGGDFASTRWRILRFLWVGARHVSAIARAVGASKSVVHRHLKRLEAEGAVTRTATGKWVYYRLVPEARAAVAFIGASVGGDPSDDAVAVEDPA